LPPVYVTGESQGCGEGISMKWKNIERKELVTIGISVAAFVLSAFSLYTTGLRVVDDVRVVISSTQLAEPDFDKKQFKIYPTNTMFTFINVGSRSAIISSISLLVSQRTNKVLTFATRCNTAETSVVNFDALPFVLRPGDMVAKDAVLVDTGSLKKVVEEDKREVVVVPFSELNAQSKSVWFRFCIEIIYTTPSVEYGSTAVSEFEDELGPGVGGYLFTSEGQPSEHRPIQVIKRSAISLFD
jgi:hypothetical protein